jgi:hypothetical protein
VANENEKLGSPKISGIQKNKINSKLSRNYRGLQKHDPNLASTKVEQDSTKQKKIPDQLTKYPSSERDMLFSFLSNKDAKNNILNELKEASRHQSKQGNAMIIFTHECQVNDSMKVKKRTQKRRSFRKSLNLISINDMNNMNDKRDRMFSPNNNNERVMFSPLLDGPNGQNKKNDFKSEFRMLTL